MNLKEYNLVKEFIKCEKDKIHFIEKYLKIINPMLGPIPFILRDFQKYYIEKLDEKSHIIVNKCRQCGLTSVNLANILYYITFNNFKTVSCVAKNVSSAKELQKKFIELYESLPKEFKIGILEISNRKIIFENHMYLTFDIPNSNSFRGRTIDYMYIEELAYFDNDSVYDFFECVLPCLSGRKTSKIIISSTPYTIYDKNNKINLFYKLWNEYNDFDKVNIGYRAFKNSEKFKEETLKIITEWQFEREFNNKFIQYV